MKMVKEKKEYLKLGNMYMKERLSKIKWKASGKLSSILEKSMRESFWMGSIMASESTKRARVNTMAISGWEDMKGKEFIVGKVGSSMREVTRKGKGKEKVASSSNNFHMMGAGRMGFRQILLPMDISFVMSRHLLLLKESDNILFLQLL